MILESRWNQGVGESDHSPTFLWPYGFLLSYLFKDSVSSIKISTFSGYNQENSPR